MARDPVCNSDLDEHQAIERGLFCMHGDRTYCFCSSACLLRFRENPEQYIGTGPEWEQPVVIDDYPG